MLMLREDFHVHTTLCDGKDTPAAMAAAALAQGLTALGFSGHAHTSFDESWCMSVENTRLYRAEIARLREEYRDRLPIWCGIEQDLYADPPEGYDYVIGSVHYVLADGVYLPVDESADCLRKAANEHFGGDPIAFCEAYYDAVGAVAEETCCDIIGHFDLVTKFNETGALFDEGDPRYIAAWQRAAGRLLAANVPFEINTGAISRGCRTAPYPAEPILLWLRDRGASFVLSGDSHSAGALCCDFERQEHRLAALGITPVRFRPKGAKTE